MRQGNASVLGHFVAPLKAQNFMQTTLYLLDWGRIVRDMSRHAHITMKSTAATAGGLSALLLLLSSL